MTQATTQTMSNKEIKQLDKQDMVKEMIRLYEEDDLTMEQIGEKYDFTKQRIQQLFKQAGVTYKTKAESKFSKAALTKYHVEQKLGAKEIAEIYGCNQTTIIKYLKEYDIRRRYPQKNMDLTGEVLKKLFVDEKMTQTEIGKKYGYVQSAVANLLKRHGIKRT